MGIIPVINCPDFACVSEKIEKLKTFLPEGAFVHCDIADGAFTFHKTWNDPTAWANLRSPFNLELHLMAEHPEKMVEPWLAAGARRFVVHIETVNGSSLASIAGMCAKRGAGVMLASSPETPVEDFTPYLVGFSAFQVLCVHPGLPGQRFLSLTMDKISWLRRQAPNAIIEVDGGINPETAKLAKGAGANFAVSSSYIFGNGDPKAAYENLKNI